MTMLEIIRIFISLSGTYFVDIFKGFQEDLNRKLNPKYQIDRIVEEGGV